MQPVADFNACLEPASGDEKHDDGISSDLHPLFPLCFQRPPRHTYKSEAKIAHAEDRDHERTGSHCDYRDSSREDAHS